MRRIVINGRFLTRPVSGVERYATEVVKALDAVVAGMPPGERPELVIVAPEGAREIEGLSVTTFKFIGRFGGHLWEQTLLPMIAKGDTLLNLCNTAPLLRREQINCIHDANVWLMPQNYSRAFRGLYRFMIPMIMKRSRAWVTDSEFSRQELGRVALAGSKPGVVLLCGHEHVQGWGAGSGELSEALLSAPFVLVVGSRAKNKNIQVVLSQAAALREAGVNVYVTGARNASVFSESGDDPLDENIVWLGSVDDAQLKALFSHAICLAFPSFFEGFGLPVLEAMALGCPVVASPTSSIPEVGGDAVLYADPRDGQAWRDAILSLARDPTLRQEHSRLGLKRAKVFSWRDVAVGYLKLSGVRMSDENAQLAE